ncbi:MAG: nucleotidyltransferase family protein [Alphaproteobacteria bacterium]|nr:nucleotidyltransferase family protein [Pseudomonadota bacterium]TDI66028.1 MAG: nucleotidyltransferase family protein [Alphaproteobacteria bacterium]
MAKNSPPKDHPAPRIAAVVLAAGRSTRAGATNKLLAPIGGIPMVARALARITGSNAFPIIVVTGHQSAEVCAALAGQGVEFAHNADFAQGMAGSIIAGIKALPGDVAAALICLGDMPAIKAAEIDLLIAAFDAQGGAAICVPKAGGRRGNPVLFARRFFPELLALTGDSGAKTVIAAHPELVAEIAMAGTGTLVDLDTSEDIAGFSARA